MSQLNCKQTQWYGQLRFRKSKGNHKEFAEMNIDKHFRLSTLQAAFVRREQLMAPCWASLTAFSHAWFFRRMRSSRMPQAASTGGAHWVLWAAVRLPFWIRPFENPLSENGGWQSLELEKLLVIRRSTDLVIKGRSLKDFVFAHRLSNSA